MLHAQLCQYLQAVHVRHDEIEKHQRDLIAARSRQKIQRGLSARRGDNRHAGARDRGFQQPALYRIVIDNKDGMGSHALHLFRASILAP
jgi:hypothetical protein